MALSAKWHAIGGFAEGLGEGIRRRRQEERVKEDRKHERVMTIVSSLLSSGRLTDENEALRFLLSGGEIDPKGKKGEIPPAIQAVVSGIKGIYPDDQAAQGTQTSQPGQTPQGPASLSGLPGVGLGGLKGISGGTPPGPPPPRDPQGADWRAQASGQVPGQTSTTVPLPGQLPQPPRDPQGAAWRAQATGQVPGQRSTTVPIPRPAPPRPGPGFGILPPEEMDRRAIERAGRTHFAQTFGDYDAKIALANRMVKDGTAKTINEAYERVGLRIPTASLTSQRWTPINTVIPVGQIPPEDLVEVDGSPINPEVTKFVKPAIRARPDGTSETRYIPAAPTARAGGAGAGDTAEMKIEKFIVKTLHPEWPEDDPATEGKINTEAAARLKTKRDTQTQGGQVRNVGTELANTQKGIILGTEPSVWDALPSTDDGTGHADPAKQREFERMILDPAKFPQGARMLNDIKQVIAYKMPLDILSTRAAGMNRDIATSLVMRYDPDYSEVEAPARKAMLSSWMGGGRTTGIGSQMASARTIIDHVSEMNQASKDIDKTMQGQTGANVAGGLFNPLLKQKTTRTGPGQAAAQKAYTDFDTAKGAVASELRRLFTVGGNTGGLAELEKWESNISATGTPAERRAFTQTALNLMFGQINSRVQEYAAVMGRTPPSGLWLDAAQRRKIRSMGYDVSHLMPESGTGAIQQPDAGAPAWTKTDQLPPGRTGKDRATGLYWRKDPDGTVRQVQPPQ